MFGFERVHLYFIIEEKKLGFYLSLMDEILLSL